MTLIGKQRIVIGMYDGFGMDYMAANPLPAFRFMAEHGFFKPVSAVFPTVTNVNNASICCGTWPKEHGITGNSYFNEQSGEADYMENADFICVPTVIQRAAERGVKSALLTCKVKTIHLLGRGAEIAVAAEAPPAEWIERYGKPANIYSREINYWLWRAAVDVLKHRPDIGLLYVHTTDYPMHTWAPAAPESKEHLATLDQLLDEARTAAPDAAFLLTADHGMNYKSRCWDLFKACRELGSEVRFALSAEKDRYVKHHRTFGGAAWVWLNSPKDEEKVAQALLDLKGVEAVLPRRDAAAKFGLMPERIGELAVFGDADTVFGELDGPMEELEAGYRSHGSLHESEIPLVIYNSSVRLPSSEAFTANLDLTRHIVT
ncbi:MAG TPA: alkaline phosphatase family protein [Candidatus Binatia bacterium]